MPKRGERDALADSIVLFSAMAVEAFINYYGVVRLGEQQFNAHFERLRLKVSFGFCFSFSTG